MKVSLENYRATPMGQNQSLLIDHFLKLSSSADPYCRKTMPGHFTASALVMDPSFQRVLLTHHRKLNRWLQLGGHADGESELWKVALREVDEESGLSDVRFWCVDPGVSSFPPAIFDLDQHWIPENPKEPGHYHYDVRYLAIAERPEKVRISDESIALEWFSWERAYEVVGENSLRRVFQNISKFLLK